MIDSTRLVGGIQIQGRATLGGNLCNAAPSADTVPTLIAYSATVTVINKSGEREIPVEDISVELSHEKIHAKDCGDCETTTGKIDVIYKSIQVTGEMSEEQRQRLLEIAERCPVNRTLQSEVKIRSK